MAGVFLNLITCDLFRTLGIPGCKFVDPKNLFQNVELIKLSDWVLFPEYWQINLLAYAYKRRIFPSISTFHFAHDKIQMTRAFMAVSPKNVPETFILSNTPENISRVTNELMLFPFVAKDVKNSGGAGVSLIENKKDWLHYCEMNNTLYVQEYLPIDRDLRLIVIGNKVIHAYWRVKTIDSFCTNVARGGEIDFDNIPLEAVQLVEFIANELKIDHAGFDVAMIGNHPYLFEFNRLFGNHGVIQKRINIAALIHEYILSESVRPIEPDFTFRKAG